MNQYRLLLGSNLSEVDLDEKVGISFSKKWENLEDPTKMYADWSKTIQLPMTANNNKLFENLYRADQVVTNAGLDPRKRVPFVLLHDQEHIVSGYAKIMNAEDSQKVKTYSLTLYSTIGEIMKELKLITFNPDNATDTKYIMRNYLSDDCRISRNLVKQSWDQSIKIHNLVSMRDIDIIGFMPVYQGKYDGFDGSKIQLLTSGSVDRMVRNYWGDDEKYTDAVDEHYLGDFRSYYQIPYIYVDALVQMIADKLRELTGYTVVLDKSWFNNRNPYYYNAILSCPSLFDASSADGEDKKEVYTDVTNIYTSNTRANEDLSSHHSQLLPLVHSSGDELINSNYIFDSPQSGRTHFHSKFTAYLFAAGYDSAQRDAYMRLSPYNSFFLEFRAVDAQTGENIPNAKKTIMFYTGSTSYTSGYDQAIDLGFANRNYPPYTATTNPDPTIITKKNGFCWKTALDIDFEIKTTNPYYIVCDQFARNNGNPLEYEIGRYVPGAAYNYPMTRYYETTGSVRGHYWYISNNDTYLTENVNSRSFSKLTMARIWKFDKNPGEYLLDYCKMFRLVFDVDEDEKQVIIMSRDRYFNNYEILDWTDKLDKTKDFKVEPINWTNKFFNFKYGDASGNMYKYYNDKYKAQYGSYKVDNGYEFSDEVIDLFDELQPSMICSKRQASNMVNTRFPNAGSAAPYLGSAWKRMPDEYYPENDDDGKYAGNSGEFYFRNFINHPPDSVLRNKDINGNHCVWLTDDTDFMTRNKTFCWHAIADDLTLQYRMPSIMPFYKTSPSANTGFSFQFQQPKEIYYNTNIINENGVGYIYDLFWKRYMDERYSPQTKVVTAYFYLTADDYLNFKFNKFVKVDNILYFVNQIFDFNLTTTKNTKVELIQVNDLGAYTDSGYEFPYLYTFDNYITVDWDNITSLEVFSSSEWHVDYCSPLVWAEKEGNNLKIRAYNINFADNTGYIALKNNENIYYYINFTVKKALPYLKLSTYNLSFSRTSGTKTVDVFTFPRGISIVSQPKWCQTDVSYLIGEEYPDENTRRPEPDMVLYVWCATNNNRFSRTGTITITNGYVERTITVTQQGRGVIRPVWPDVPVIPDVPEIPDYPVLPVRLERGEVTNITLYTDKQVKLNSAIISNGIVSVNGSNNIDIVSFAVQPKFSAEALAENKSADGGIIQIQTEDGDLIQWAYNLGDVLQRYTVLIESLDLTKGSVTIDGVTNTYYNDDEAGTTHTISCTAETGWIFECWNDGDTNASRTITVNSDIVLYPIYHEDRPLATYTVTNTLTNVVTSNSQTTALEGGEYRATLTPYRWYTMDSVNVTMGGVDITTNVYRNGSLYIPEITGNIVITATAGYGEWDYVWSSQEPNGPIDPYTSQVDAGSFVGPRNEVWGENPWCHNNTNFNLPSHSNSEFEYQIECGFVPLADLTDFPGSPSIQIKGGFIAYFDQTRRKVYSDLGQTWHNYVDTRQTIMYGKEPQLLSIYTDTKKAQLKYGNTLNIAGVMPSGVGSDVISPYFFNGTPRGSIMYIYTIRYRVKPLPDNKTVKVKTEDSSKGTVSVNGVPGDFNQILRAGTQILIEANPNTGYRFRYWTDYNTNQTRTYTVTSASTQRLTAYFEQYAPANNEIWYVSSDGMIVEPTTPANITDSNNNSLNIITNVYYAGTGKGIMTFDGDVAKIKGATPVAAFRGCSTLLQVTVPSSVTFLGGFSNCNNLYKINGIENVVEIGEDAFASTAFESFEMPDSVTTIANGIFANCDKLVKVAWGRNVTSCDNNIFNGCDSLTYFESNGGAVDLNALFRDCVNLKSYKFTGDEFCLVPAWSTFNGCTSLADVDFSDATITEIGDRFISNTKVTSLKLPSTLERISPGMTTCIVLNNYLNSIVLGANLQYIGDRGLAANPNLKYIYCYAQTAPTLGSDVFLHISTSGELHIPNGSDYSSWVSQLPNGGQDWVIYDDL